MSGQTSNIDAAERQWVNVKVSPETLFSVPEGVLLTELPDDSRSQDYLKVNVGPGSRYCYVPSQCLFVRPEHESGRMDIPSQPPTTRTRRDRENQELKHENAKLRRDLKRDAETITGLMNKVQKWREAYDSMRYTKNYAEHQAASQYNQRIRLENIKNGTIEQMTQQIFQLRSDIEEFKITEDDLLNEYETLISSIKGCVGMLGYYLGLSDTWSANEQMVRSKLGFDSPVLSQHALHEYRLPTEMLRLLIEAAQNNLFYNLTCWQGSDGQETAPLGALGAALSGFEADVTNFLKGSDGENPSGMAAKNQKIDPVTLGKAFYRWRSDTVRLLNYISKRTPSNGKDQQTARLAESICLDVLTMLSTPKSALGGEHDLTFQVNQLTTGDQQLVVHQYPQWFENGSLLDSDLSPVDEPLVENSPSHPNARLLELINMVFGPARSDEREAIAETFKAKVVGCVEQAMFMYCRMRCCRANYTFLFPKDGEVFQRGWLNICSPFQDEARHYRDADMNVAHCTYPALLKYGNDDGRNYEVPKLIRKAEVIVSVSPKAKKIGQTQVNQLDPDHDSQESETEETTSKMQRLGVSKAPERPTAKQDEGKTTQEVAIAKNKKGYLAWLPFSLYGS